MDVLPCIFTRYQKKQSSLLLTIPVFKALRKLLVDLLTSAGGLATFATGGLGAPVGFPVMAHGLIGLFH
jgi:hypothetical protein